MTEQPADPAGGQTASSSTAPPPASSAAGSDRAPTFEERMNRFGREAGEAGERFGRRAEAAAHRWSGDPGVVRAAETANRIWGLILLVVGLWFFAQITLDFDMPAIDWRALWPIALIGIGLLVVARGITRRA